MRCKLSSWMVPGWSAIAVALIYSSQGAIAAEVMTAESLAPASTVPESIAVEPSNVEPIAAEPAIAEATLPSADDLPEEVARTQIILEARSPVDGRPLSAAEYAELQTQLAARDRAPQLRSEIRQIIFLLEFRRGLYDLLPFLSE